MASPTLIDAQSRLVTDKSTKRDWIKRHPGPDMGGKGKSKGRPHKRGLQYPSMQKD